MRGVQGVGAGHQGVVRASASHGICQVGVDVPVLMASLSPKHDTDSRIAADGGTGASPLDRPVK